MLSLQRQVQHRRSHLRHFSASHLRQVGRKSLTSSMAHVSEAPNTNGNGNPTFPAFGESTGATDLPRPRPSQVDEKAPYLEILSPDQMRPPVQTRVTFDEETEVFTLKEGWVGWPVPTVSYRFGWRLEVFGCRNFVLEVLLIDTVGDILVDNVQSSAF